MISELNIRKQICDIGVRMYNREMVAANDGNISVRISENEIICTPTGVSKGFMTPDMLCKIDLNGKNLCSESSFKPSTEIKMHLKVYKKRKDINAVVHAHPVYSTVYAAIGKPLTSNILSEAVIQFGEVPVAKFALPSTEEVPNSIEQFLDKYEVLLLQNHGALSWGYDIEGAYMKMESLEFYAKVLYKLQVIGLKKEIPKNEVKRLYEIRQKLGLKGSHPFI